ncbi:hypothetical protein [Acetobacter persici]|uniref:Uncharacterized protein n=1 Tax=Acetobacter persici TaxID=1076596 RepID=A0A1U9LC91_9PROT|nr:hypothetical protein [Acetobacter persici]AQT04083.1 hypothetical protein A0U91_02615 [Acetobacter persici]
MIFINDAFGMGLFTHLKTISYKKYWVFLWLLSGRQDVFHDSRDKKTGKIRPQETHPLIAGS